MHFQLDNAYYQMHQSPRTNDDGMDDTTHVVVDDRMMVTTKLSLPKKQSSILGASSNLVNSIVGAGIIGIPYAMRMSGLYVGIFLLLLVSALTDKSLRILIEQSSFHPKLCALPVYTFEELASYPFGKFGYRFILANMFIMAYGAMIAYLLIIKDTIPTAALGYDHGTHMLERNLILVVTSLVIMVPLSMQRDMASLSLTSAFSVGADIILVVFIAAFAPIRETISNSGGIGQVLKNEINIHPTLFIGLGILSTAMACQHSAFIVANSLENKTRQRWQRVTNQSIALSAILCLILGVCGYLGFLGLTEGDVLNSFPAGSEVANIARLLLAFTMFLTYPMESFVARHVLVMLLYDGDMDAASGSNSSGVGSTSEEDVVELDEGVNGTDNAATVHVVVEGGGVLCLNRRQTLTALVYLLTLFPALLVNDIGPVLSLTGAIGGSCISYIGSGLVYLGVNGDELLCFIGSWVDRWRRARKGHMTTTPNVDLPVDGDATLRMSDSNEVSAVTSYESITSGSKPMLYYLGLFPLWTYIAHKGATNMRMKISAANTSVSGGHIDEIEILPGATRWDFAISFFFILFGVVAMVAGVYANIYFQLNNLDEVSP